MYAIKARASDNLDMGYRNRNIYILSGSQAAIKALYVCQINSKLVWDCHQSLAKLARHTRVQLLWVPGHRGIEGNETADQPARQGSECPLIGTEPAFGISAGITK
jgi:ribonuclease HI